MYTSYVYALHYRLANREYIAAHLMYNLLVL